MQANGYAPARPGPARADYSDLMVTVFDAGAQPRTVRLSSFGRPCVTFGRGAGNDIIITSPIVSREHGRFRFENNRWIIEDRAVFGEKPSGNGLLYNSALVTSRILSDGDFIRIDDGVETIKNGVLMVFSVSGSNNRWYSLPTAGRREITVGRDPGCGIVLPHVSVSKLHARIVLEQDGWYIVDCNSTNGLSVNNRRLNGRAKLHEKDVIVITNTKLIFTSAMVSFCCYRSGISVDAANLVVVRREKKGSKVTCDHVSLGIRPGELVAIVGGSGAGKSTVMNCLCGYLHPTEGDVFINGVNLYENFDSLKNLVGYVPQSDIVYDNLTLHDMLLYTAQLRLPEDMGDDEREAAIARAINMVELPEKRDSLIRSLSGGQRKRASIAVELLSDPNLLFLDEPASGLDPGTERSLMRSLRSMADSGKTVILVTHSTLQLRMCDKIVFMGRDGRLCFCGGYNEALNFFGVSDVVDIYNMMTEDSKKWSELFEKTRSHPGKARRENIESKPTGKNQVRQLKVLSRRYMKLVLNDRQRFLLLMLQAPLLAVLISLVADGNQFEQYEMTKSLLFALSCSAFWVGMLNAIQEICKERTIMKREYMTGLSLTSYVSSKIIVLGAMCLVQSAMITVVFSLLVGLPDQSVMLGAFLELFITTFLTAVCSTAMGLLVSSLFTNADRAMTLAPILLMPQILFSGLIFKLSGATEAISWFAVCRWSMEGYGTTADLNSLTLRLQQEGIFVPHEPEDFFEFSSGHLLVSWLILIGFTAAFLIAARAILNRSVKKDS